jgi:hypothetical protein
MQGRSLIFGATLLLAASHVLAAADQVTFRFAPPAGKTWKETSKVKTEIPIPGRDLRRITETETVSRLAVRPGELSATVVSATNKLEGKVMESPLYQALPGLTLTFKVGPDGQILDLAGFPKLLDQVRKTTPPERLDQVNLFFTAEALLSRTRAAADPLTSGLAGKTLAVGSSTAVPGSVHLPNGESFPVRLTVTLKGKEPSPACPACVRLDFTSAPVLQTGKPADVGATGSGTALIDPATLLTWSLKHEETIVMQEPGSPATRMKVGLNAESSLAPEK